MREIVCRADCQPPNSTDYMRMKIAQIQCVTQPKKMVKQMSARSSSSSRSTHTRSIRHWLYGEINGARKPDMKQYREELKDMKQYKEELKDMKQYQEELKDMKQYKEELKDMKQYKEELKDMKQYKEELKEMKQYKEELKDMKQYKEELKDMKQYKEERHCRPTLGAAETVKCQQIRRFGGAETVECQQQKNDKQEKYQKEQQLNIVRSKRQPFEIVCRADCQPPNSTDYMRMKIAQIQCVTQPKKMVKQMSARSSSSSRSTHTRSIRHWLYGEINGARKPDMKQYREELKDMKQYKEELKDMKQYQEELKDMKQYKEELKDMKQYKEELKDMKQYKEELKEMKQYQEELKDMKQYKEELKDMKQYKEELKALKQYKKEFDIKQYKEEFKLYLFERPISDTDHDQMHS
uniref:Uncharacterized protein n=1 Tax=Globodera rostochiensis TaxID=31243 RepID=A0A914ICW0_GLORO